MTALEDRRDGTTQLLSPPSKPTTCPRSTGCAGRGSSGRRRSSGSAISSATSKKSQSRTAKSAEALRTILGPIRMDLLTPDIGRPFYRAVTTLDALALTEAPPAGAEGGSNSLQRWRRRVQRGRNSLSPSGDSVAASGRVVAEPIVCGRLLVAVCGECEVESTRARSSPTLTGPHTRRVARAGRRGGRLFYRRRRAGSSKDNPRSTRGSGFGFRVVLNVESPPAPSGRLALGEPPAACWLSCGLSSPSRADGIQGMGSGRP